MSYLLDKTLIGVPDSVIIFINGEEITIPQSFLKNHEWIRYYSRKLLFEYRSAKREAEVKEDALPQRRPLPGTTQVHRASGARSKRLLKQEKAVIIKNPGSVSNLVYTGKVFVPFSDRQKV
jgi:hypothetical protein